MSIKPQFFKKIEKFNPIAKSQTSHGPLIIYVKLKHSQELPSGTNGKESAGDLGSIPGLGNIPWRRAWKPIPLFLPGESPWTEKPGRLQPVESQSVRHH